MNDLDVMKRAQGYIESMANGVDPLTGGNIPDSDIVNNVRISRCLFYVSDVLKKVIANGGEVQREKLKKSERADFELTDEQAAALKPSDETLSASRLAALINSQIDEYTMKKLKGTTITYWLMKSGFLEETEDSNGNICKLPTSEGDEIGITERDFDKPDGRKVWYAAYTPAAQQFIIDNIAAISAAAIEEEEERKANKNAPAQEE